jgi:hypothetical protein
MQLFTWDDELYLPNNQLVFSGICATKNVMACKCIARKPPVTTVYV